MSTKHQLRLNGYSVNDAGHIECFRSKERGSNRYAHERCGIVRIDVSPGYRDARALVDRLIAAIDEPRALRGTARDGSCVLLFRAELVSNETHKLALRATGELVAITIGSEGQTVDVDAYSWLKGRSPADVSRDALPPLFADIGKAAVNAAYASGCAWVSQVEQERAADARMADIKSGKIKIPTEEERQAAEDDALVAQYQGVEFGRFDDLRATVHGARYRVANRQAAETATATTAA